MTTQKTKKTPADASAYRVASIQIKIDRTRHTIAKRFHAEKTPIAAVVVTLLATNTPHVITWTQNAKSAAAHARRVAKQYCGSDATIEQRYANPVVVPVDVRVATDEDMTARATTEDRNWITLNRNAAGLNKNSNAAANAAEMDA